MENENKGSKSILTFENLKNVLVCGLGACIWGYIIVGMAKEFLG
ncbi:MAG: hypothetical protein ACJAVO_000190 [Parvibaculaceae bacterium]|jgi:hypothetical protein